MIFTKLWYDLRDRFWGSDLGRARRYLVLSILAVSLLGRVAYWGKPRLDRWMNPPEPAVIGTCTERAISVGSTPLVGDLSSAKQRVGRPDITIITAAWVWNQQEERLEFWLITAEDVWQLEFVCFEIVRPGQNYGAQFGEFRVDSIKDLRDWDSKLKAIETGK